MRISQETKTAASDFCINVQNQIEQENNLSLPKLVTSIMQAQKTNENPDIKKMFRKTNNTDSIVADFLKIANTTGTKELQNKLSTKINSMVALPLLNGATRYNTGLFAKQCYSSPCIFQRMILSFRTKITTLILWVNNLGERHPNRKCILDALQNAYALTKTKSGNKEEFCKQADGIIVELTKAQQLLDKTTKTFTGKQRAAEITTIQTKIKQLINEIDTSKEFVAPPITPEEQPNETESTPSDTQPLHSPTMPSLPMPPPASNPTTEKRTETKNIPAESTAQTPPQRSAKKSTSTRKNSPKTRAPSTRQAARDSATKTSKLYKNNKKHR